MRKLITFCFIFSLGLSALGQEIQSHKGGIRITLPDSLYNTYRSSKLIVYRAEGRTAHYQVVGKFKGNTFTDKKLKSSPFNYYYKVKNDEGKEIFSTSLQKEIWGEQIYVYSPSDDMELVGKEVNAIHDKMFRDQFSHHRYAILFKPGNYRQAGDLNVPYYMHIAGLGETPYAVQLHNIHTPAPLPNNNGTCTFWRSAENFSVIGPQSYTEEKCFRWAVSQAAPLRRIHSTRTMRNQWGNGWVSGGYAADCDFQAPAGSDHQQQWYYRNSVLQQGRGQFREIKYNYCFQGVELGPDVDKDTYRDNWADGGNVTFIPTTPVIREKPFLYVDKEGNYKVFRPSLRHKSHGLSYSRDYIGEGESLDVMSSFFIAKPTHTASQLNEALRKGKHLLFTPGMYRLNEPLRVDKPGTILLGLGYATLIPWAENSQAAIIVGDVDGVSVASLMFDAHQTSQSLLIVGGDEKSARRHSHNPIVLSDLFFRIGGFRPGKVHVEASVIINSHDVIGDHFWIWRADHGVRGSVGWYVNTAPHGLVVNGDHVTLYALFNEHFQSYQTLWNGEHGSTYFFQCESPYDAPKQDAYMSENGTKDGFAAYKVAPNVKHHYATAFGIYDVLHQEIRIHSSVEVPVCPDVRLHHICNNSLSSPPNRGFGYVVNDATKSTYNTFRDNRTYIVDFPQ